MIEKWQRYCVALFIFHMNVHLFHYLRNHTVYGYFKITTNHIFLKLFESILALAIFMSISFNVINMFPMDILYSIKQFLSTRGRRGKF